MFSKNIFVGWWNLDQPKNKCQKSFKKPTKNYGQTTNSHLR